MNGITYEKARAKAYELKDDIARCIEYKDAWIFASKKGDMSIGGFSEPVVVLKSNGEVVNQTYYYDIIGGGLEKDKIDEYSA